MEEIAMAPICLLGPEGPVVTWVGRIQMQRSIFIALLLLGLLAVSFDAAEAKKNKGPKVTAKVYFDITIDGKEAGNRSHRTSITKRFFNL